MTAPLNPAYREEEFAFYLEDLKARAVILMEGEVGPAAAAAGRLGTKIIRLVPDTAGPVGSFGLTGDPADTAGDRASPEGTDVALILHTSGTTSRPEDRPAPAIERGGLGGETSPPRSISPRPTAAST